MSSEKDIYLINNASTCKDIRENIFLYYKQKKKQGLNLNKDQLSNIRKLKKIKTDKLSLNGILEINELKKHEDTELSTLKNTSNYFYCLCDRISIETALIYLNKSDTPYLTLRILPFIAFETSIKKASDLMDFKKSFGMRYDNNMKNYWNIKSNIINLKKSVHIDWSLFNNLDFSKIKNFNYSSMMNYIVGIRKRFPKTTKIALFCNYEIIKNTLKKFSKIESYKPKNEMKIYSTHCLKLKYKDIGSELKLLSHDTIYPYKLGNKSISYNFEGVIYDLHYQYYSKKRILTDKLNIIPDKRCIDDNLNISEIIDSINSSKKNTKTKNSISNINSFNNIFTKLN
tara:strand:+ start:1786 stop:2811 length:1026 start_codon:yes stop_codon:yes gene_type:complete